MRPNYDVRKVYVGDGILDTFSFDWKLVLPNHMKVLLVDADDSVLWSVYANDTTYFTTSINQNNMGGTITFVTPPEVDQKIIMLLADDSPTQPSKYTGDARYWMRQIEQSLDTLSGQIQRIKYQGDRSIRIPEKFVDNFKAELEEILPEHAVFINEDGDAFELIPRSALKGDPGTPGVSPSFYYQDEEPTGADTGSIWINSDTGEVFKLISGDWVSQGIMGGGIIPPTDEFALLESQDDGGTLKGSWSLPIVYSGFTERWNEIIDLKGIKPTLDYIMKMGYAPPNVSLSSSVSTANRERGNAITSMTLTSNTTKTLNDIAQVRFYQGGTLLDTQTSGGAIPNGGTNTYSWSGSFDNNTSFSVQVDDDSAQSKPSRTATINYNFFYAYLHGKGDAGLTPSEVYGLNKVIATPSASQSISYSLAVGEKPYFAYPASLADLTSIKNINNLETIGSWTKRTENITNAYGATTSYKIYEFNNLAGEANSNTYTFIR